MAKKKSMSTESKLLLIWTIWQYIEAAILITIGILVTVFANNNDFRMFIAIFIGVLIILDGAFRLGLYYTNQIRQSVALLIIGILELTIGIFICVLNTQVIEFLQQIITVLLIVAGVALIPDAILKATRKNHDVFMIVIEFVLAIVLLALGITSAVMWGLQGETHVIIMIVGILMALLGVGLLVITTIKLIHGKKVLKSSGTTKGTQVTTTETEIVVIDPNK